MSVNLSIPGDAAAVRTLGDWMATMNAALVEVDLELAYIANDGQYYMQGEAGSAFQRTTTSVRTRCKPAMPYLSNAATVVHAYANRLDRGREDFDAYLAQAQERGLTVYGRTVLPPSTSLPVCPAPDAEPELVAEWNEYVSLVTTYNDLSQRVGTWWGELEAWIAEHLAPLVADLEDLSSLDGLIEDLTAVDPNDIVVDTALESADARIDHDLAEWRQTAQTMQTDAEKLVDQLRSGNPAARAAAEAANPRAVREGMEELLEHVDEVSRIGKVIPIVGPVIDVVTVGAAISEGDSGSSAIVEAIAGAGGGAAVGGGIAAAGGPVGWVIGGAIVGGIAVGAVARWGWEAWVPIDVRESIDEWLEDGTRVWQPPQLAS